LPSEEVTPPVTKTYFDMDRAPPGVFRMLPKTALAGNGERATSGPEGGPMFRLEPMDDATYRAWRAASQRSYASEKVKAGNWKAEDADRLSQEAFDSLLPNGFDTPNQEMRAMRSEAGDNVGHAWFTIEDREPGRVVFIYDIEVYEAHRRRGYARAALAEIEAFAREQDCAGVMLHVFGYNTPARELYRSVGFDETNVIMLKRVEGEQQ
jgi:ribosomal protein S18 acetylase RimI-like enzyme